MGRICMDELVMVRVGYGPSLLWPRCPVTNLRGSRVSLPSMELQLSGNARTFSCKQYGFSTKIWVNDYMSYVSWKSKYRCSRGQWFSVDICHTGVWESNVIVFKPANENNNKELCFVPLLASLAIILNRLLEPQNHVYRHKYKLLWI